MCCMGQHLLGELRVGPRQCEDSCVRRLGTQRSTHKTKSPLWSCQPCLADCSLTCLAVLSSLMMVNNAWSCEVGWSTSALSGSSGWFVLTVEAGRDVVVGKGEGMRLDD